MPSSGESYSLTGLKATCFYGVKGDSPVAEVATVEPKVAAAPVAAKEKTTQPA
jgi:hypothetical protein